MQILFLTKRRYTRRDVLETRYGRLWHLPAGLAAAGHRVTVFCSAYYAEPGCDEVELAVANGSVQWRSVKFNPYSPLAWLSHKGHLAQFVQTQKIDCIVAASDAFHIILGASLSADLSVPLIVDYYDNFESFSATRIPGVLPLLRSATRQAALVTCVSERLKAKLVDEYRLKNSKVRVLENGVEQGFFTELNRKDARTTLGLPHAAKLVGTAGELAPNRGIGNLIQAFMAMVEKDASVVLVLAGKLSVELPVHPNIRYLGELEHAAMPSFWRALDVAVICVLDDEFGRYCFPQKLAEITAAGVPVVFPNVGVLEELNQAKKQGANPENREPEWVDEFRSVLGWSGRLSWTPSLWSVIGAEFSEFVADLVV